MGGGISSSGGWWGSGQVHPCSWPHPLAPAQAPIPLAFDLMTLPTLPTHTYDLPTYVYAMGGGISSSGGWWGSGQVHPCSWPHPLTPTAMSHSRFRGCQSLCSSYPHAAGLSIFKYKEDVDMHQSNHCDIYKRFLAAGDLREAVDGDISILQLSMDAPA